MVNGCGSNIQHIPTTMDKIENDRMFNGSFEKVWTTTVRVMSEDETFNVLDKSEGIIVTELKTVDSKELSIVKTTFLGKTYKYSYS